MTATFRMRYASFQTLYIVVLLPLCVFADLLVLFVKQAPTFASREANALGGAGFGRGIGGGMSGLPIADSAVMTRPRSAGLDLASNGRDVGFVRQRPEDRIARSDREMAHLPPDASNTLYVEGFPPDCSRREVARILFNVVVMLNNDDTLCLALFNSYQGIFSNYYLCSFTGCDRYISTFCGI